MGARHAALEPARLGRRAEAAAPQVSLVLPLLGSAVAGAWLIAILAQASGEGGVVHQQALLSVGGPPLWLALPDFLGSWQVMIAAMMVPASIPAIGLFEATVRPLARPWPALAGFLGAYVLAWTIFGLLAFLGAGALDRLIGGWVWLATRPWLAQAAVVGVAGIYQFLPLKRGSLAACRHPASAAGGPSRPFLASLGRRSGRVGFRAGLEHAADCIGSSWMLMLVMIAAGLANLFWMAALTAVMAYEVLGRHGERASVVVGIALLTLAGVSLLGGGLPV